jgi:hypothetical protein
MACIGYDSFVQQLSGNAYLTHAHLLYISYRMNINIFCLTVTTRDDNNNESAVSLQLLNPFKRENTSICLYAQIRNTDSTSETGHYESLQIVLQTSANDRVGSWKSTDPVTQV